MSDLAMLSGRLRAGVWWVDLADAPDAPEPRIVARHEGRVLADVTLAATEPGRWRARVPLPAGLLSDGVHTVLLVAEAPERTLGTLSILCGAPLEADLRAEIDLLRAELDLMKAVLRRHLSESAGPPDAG